MALSCSDERAETDDQAEGVNGYPRLTAADGEDVVTMIWPHQSPILSRHHAITLGSRIRRCQAGFRSLVIDQHYHWLIVRPWTGGDACAGL